MTLAYVYQLLNAATGSARHVDLEAHTRLFHDAQQVYEGQPMALQTVIQKDPKHLIATGTMKLSALMRPGDYVLQVIVTDKSGGDKRRVATQSTDFEVEH